MEEQPSWIRWADAVTGMDSLFGDGEGQLALLGRISVHRITPRAGYLAVIGPDAYEIIKAEPDEYPIDQYSHLHIALAFLRDSLESKLEHDGLNWIDASGLSRGSLKVHHRISAAQIREYEIQDLQINRTDLIREYPSIAVERPAGVVTERSGGRGRPTASWWPASPKNWHRTFTTRAFPRGKAPKGNRQS